MGVVGSDSLEVEGIAEEADNFMASIISRDAVALGGCYLERLEASIPAPGDLPAEVGSIATTTFDEFRKGNAVEICGQ